MSEPEQKISEFSSGYEDYSSLTSYYNEEAEVCSAEPKPAGSAQTPTEQVSAPADGFSENSESLQGLDLNSPVQVQGAAGTHTLNLRQVLEGAGRGEQPAIDALTHIIQVRLANYAETANLDMSFVACEDNTVDLLTQLAHGDETQQWQAARSILFLITGNSDQDSQDLRGLKKGLLVAAGIVDSEIYYQTIQEELTQEQLQRLQKLTRDAQNPLPRQTNLKNLLHAISHNRAFRNQNNSSKQNVAQAIEGGGSPIPAPAGVDTRPEFFGPHLARASTLATDLTSQLLAQATQALARTLSEHPEVQKYLSTGQSQGVLPRVHQLFSRSDLTTDQKLAHAGIAFRAQGFPSSLLVSAEEDYTQLQAASQSFVAHLAGRLGINGAGGDTSSPDRSGVGISPDSQGNSALAAANLSTVAGTRSSVPASLGETGTATGVRFFLGNPAETGLNPYAIPSAITTTNAALASLPRYALGFNSAWNATGLYQSNRPTPDYIEEASEAGADSGSQGGSSQQGQSQHQGNQYQGSTAYA